MQFSLLILIAASWRRKRKKERAKKRRMRKMKWKLLVKLLVFFLWNCSFFFSRLFHSTALIFLLTSYSSPHSSSPIFFTRSHSEFNPVLSLSSPYISLLLSPSLTLSIFLHFFVLFCEKEPCCSSFYVIF